MNHNISVHVVPVAEGARLLRSALLSFQQGSTDPVILGEGTTPQAALVGIEVFQRLADLRRETVMGIEMVDLVGAEKRIAPAIRAFGDGDRTPLVFDAGGGEGGLLGALLPFENFLTLAGSDIGSEELFQGELSRRVAEADARTAPAPVLRTDEDFDRWVENSFGSIGSEWVRDRHAQEGSDE